MKNLKVLIVLITAVIFFPVIVSAQTRINPESTLRRISGDWYDNSGNLILSIKNGFINGCRVLYCQGIAGGGGLAGGYFCILEGNGERNIYLEWNLQNSPADSLKVEKKQTLHKNFPFHFESVNKIHLGMTKDEVIRITGNKFDIISANEMSTLTRDSFGLDGAWFVKNLGLIITFDAGSVDRLILLKSSKNFFDKSHLNCSNTFEEFAANYSMKHLPKFGMICGIGNGEYIFFGKDMNYVCLSNYCN